MIDRLSQHFEVDYNDQDAALSPDALAARLSDKVGAITLLSDRIEAPILAAAPGLKAVCNVAVGYNNFDIAAITAAGVMATNTPGVLNDTTADTAWALLLASGRRIVAADKWVRDGRWKGWKFHDGWYGNDIHHATLGILGMGRIGQAVARRAAGFEMRVIYHNRSQLPPDQAQACNATWVSKDALLREADFLVLLLPYTPDTHHVIGAAEIAQMKPTAHLINIARGGIVDDGALIEALQSGRIAGAGLDVFAREPLAEGHPLWGLPNVLLTPHVSAVTRTFWRREADLILENLAHLLAGEPLRNEVDKARGY